MRPPPVSSSSSPGHTDPLADWVEDYVMDQVLTALPAGVVVDVSAERRSDYYAVKVFTTDLKLMPQLTSLASEIEKGLAGQGVTAVVYPQWTA